MKKWIAKMLFVGLLIGIGQISNDVRTSEAKVKGLAYPTFTMMVGEHLQMQFTNGEEASSYTWASSDKSVATVSNKGEVKAKKKGTATITATSEKGTHECELTVKKKLKKVIYLTFDDGPSRSSTPRILNILKRNKVKATFFELKPAKADYDLTRRVIKEGHTLAIHGYQHKYDKIYRSDSSYHKNVTKLQKLFYKDFGVWCTVTRFPGGSSNAVSRHYNKGIMTRLVKKIGKWGFHYMDWNVSSGDAGDVHTANGVYRNVVRGISSKHPNVVLMHDFPNNNKTIQALDRIIKYGKQHGYKFLPMTASTTEVHHLQLNN